MRLQRCILGTTELGGVTVAAEHVEPGLCEAQRDHHLHVYLHTGGGEEERSAVVGCLQGGGAALKVADTNRLDKLMGTFGSVLSVELDPPPPHGVLRTGV